MSIAKRSETSRPCKPGRCAGRILLGMAALLGALGAGAVKATFEHADASPARKHAVTPKLFPALGDSQQALPKQKSEPENLVIRVHRRGPYGELTGVDERIMTPKDWGRTIDVAGMTIVARPLPSLAAPALAVQIRPTGYAIKGPTRPQGTLGFVVPLNGRLHTVVGASPGPLADVLATYGQPVPTARRDSTSQLPEPQSLIR